MNMGNKQTIRGVEAFVLSDGSRVAFTETSYFVSRGAEQYTGAAAAFDEDHPAWAEEVRRLRIFAALQDA